MQHRRRKATAEKLAQGERDMKEAQKRMEREAEALGELPLEDGVVDEKGNGKDGKGKKSKKALSNCPQTPSTAAVPSSGESHTKVSLPSNTSTEVDSRSPDAPRPEGPPRSIGPATKGMQELMMPDEKRPGMKPKLPSLDEAVGSVEGEVKVEEERFGDAPGMVATVHSIATPPCSKMEGAPGPDLG